MSRPVGLTKDAGFEIGLSRTVDVPPDRAWAVIVSDVGVRTWLGDGVRLPAEKGRNYESVEGTRGQIRSYHASGRLRLTGQPASWHHPTTVQVTVSERGGKSVIRFHQERLVDPAERARQREHWRAVMDDIVALLC